MMGTQPAPVPPLSQSFSVDRDTYSAPPANNFVNSQSAMPMSSSASEQFVSAMAEDSGPDRKGSHNRSVSEPDFKRQQVVLLFC
jgi:oxalate decarboxylase/phosphoglucose isomerase-like protein (cupin superfamily)